MDDFLKTMYSLETENRKRLTHESIKKIISLENILLKYLTELK